MGGSKIVFSKGTQLTVYIDNRKGTLSALATFLGKHGVNIYGLTLARDTGIQVLHVPFRGSAAAVNALVAGDIDFIIDGAITRGARIAREVSERLA